MFIIDLNNKEENEVYKILKQLHFKYQDNHILFNSDTLIDKDFINRIIANEWYLDSSYYLVVSRVDEYSLENLLNITDIIKGIVISFKDDTVTKDYIQTLIDYCLENNLEIKFINNRNLTPECFELLKPYMVPFDGGVQ